MPAAPAESSLLLVIKQLNSSLVVDDVFSVKVYRRLEAGENPDLELTRFLVSHGYEHVPLLYGWWSYSGPLLGATLGLVQRYMPGSIRSEERRVGKESRDGWST